MAAEEFDEFDEFDLDFDEYDEDESDDLDDDDFDDFLAEFEVEDPSGFPWAAFLTTTILAGIAAVLGVTYLRRRGKLGGKPKTNTWASRSREENPEPKETATDVPVHGLLIEGDKMRVADWNLWLPYSSHQIQRFVNEGAAHPSEVVARLFYSCFPNRTWPPLEDSPLRRDYDAIVATAGLNLDHALRPVRVQDAGRRGIKLVEE